LIKRNHQITKAGEHLKTVRELQQYEPIQVHYGKLRKPLGCPTSFALKGELGYRLALSAKRIEQAFPYTQEYLLSQVSAQDGEWSNFPRFHGDVAGRWVLAETYLYSAQQTAPDHLRSLVDQLLALQNADGSFGKVSLEEYPLNKQKAYGNGWLLQALAQYAYTFREEQAAGAAMRLGEFYRKTFHLWTEADGHRETDFYAVSVNAYYHALPGLAALYRLTADPSIINLIRDFVPRLPRLDQADHSHMYLTTRRGLLDLLEFAPDLVDLETTKAELDKMYQEFVLETGGIPERFQHAHGTIGDDEGCSLFDWLIVCARMYTATGETRWIDRAIFNLENHIFYNQTNNGGFGSYDMDSKYKQFGKEAFWCCSIYGPYGLIDGSSFFVRKSGETLEVNHLVSGDFTFESGDTVRLTHDEEHCLLTIDLTAAPEITSISIYTPAWLSVDSEEGQEVGYRISINVSSRPVVAIPYQYQLWFSKPGVSPQRKDQIQPGECVNAFYGPWLLTHRYPDPVIVTLPVDPRPDRSMFSHQHLLGLGFFGESKRIILPAEIKQHPEDPLSGVFEKDNQLFMYPLKSKETPALNNNLIQLKGEVV
jgi:hypothetical protein